MRVSKQQPPRGLPWPKHPTSKWWFPIIAEAKHAFHEYMTANSLNEKQTCAQAQIDYSKWNAAKRGVGPWHLELVIGALQLMGKELIVQIIPGSWADPDAPVPPPKPVEERAVYTPNPEILARVPSDLTRDSLDDDT